MSTTSYSAQILLANLLGVTMGTPTWPTQWFVAASTTTPTFAKGTNWNFTEPTDPAYARQSALWQAGGYQPPTAYSQEPTAAVTFPTASQSWGTASYIGVFDSLGVGTGNLWFYVPLVRTTSDGVLTAGSTTVSSATMAFTSSDVGQLISAQGVPIGTTIVSQTGTAAVMSAESSVSATSVVLAVGTPKVVLASESLTLSVGNLLVEMG